MALTPEERAAKERELKMLELEQLEAEEAAFQASITPTPSRLTEEKFDIGAPAEQKEDALGMFIPEEAQETMGRIRGAITGVEQPDSLAEEPLGLAETARLPLQVGARVGLAAAESIREGREQFEAEAGRRAPLLRATEFVADLAIPQTEFEVLMDATNPVGHAFSIMAKGGKLTAEAMSSFSKAAKDYLMRDRSSAASKRLFAWAQSHGVELLPGQLKDNKAMLGFEALVEKGEVFTSFMKDHMEKQKKALSEVAEKIRRKMGSANYKSSGMGEQLQRSIHELEDEFRAIASKNYDAIPAEGGDVVLKEETAPLIQKLNEMIEQVKQKVPAQRNAKLLSTLEQWRGRAIRGGQIATEQVEVTGQLGEKAFITVSKAAPKDAALTFNEVLALRSEVGQAKAAAKGDPQVRGVYDQIFRVISSEVEPKMIKSGNVPRELSEAAEHARAFYRSGFGKDEGIFNNKLVKDIASSKNPEALVRMTFRRGNMTNLKVLKRFLNGGEIEGLQKTDAWENVTREFTEDLLTKRIEGIDTVDPSNLLKKLRQMGHNEEFLEIVYGREGASELINLADTWETLSRQSRIFANPSGTATPVIQFQQVKEAVSRLGAGALSGSVGATLGGGIGGATAVLSPSAVAYLYTHKEGRKLILDAMNTTLDNPDVSAKLVGRIMSFVATRATRDREREENPISKRMGKEGLRAL